MRRTAPAPLVLAVAVLAALAAACTGPSTGVTATGGTGTGGTGTAVGTSAGTTAPPVGTTAPPLMLVACGQHQTFPYATYPGVDPNLNRLDVYVPPAAADGACRGRPIVVWVHGGGWTGGDKTEYMTDKVTLFNGAGYLFASVNYRLTDKAKVPPGPQHPVHDQDTADAVAWIVEHAAELGGDPTRVAVLGHSAGGGITAAISTDEAYLGKGGLPLTTIRCAGSMDGEGYDITAGATTSDPAVQTGYRNAFGSDPAGWASASPVNHVAAGKGIPRFFIAARGTDWRLSQHLAFIDALRTAGVPTTVLDARTLEHADLAVDVGAPGDTVVTPPLMDFLGGCFTAGRREPEV